MFKGVTLLRDVGGSPGDESRVEGMDAPDEPSRRLPGLFQYNQNRVEDLCWRLGADHADIATIGELWFAPFDGIAFATAMSTKEKRHFYVLTSLVVDNAWVACSDARYKFMLIGDVACPSRTSRALIETMRTCADEHAPAEFCCECLRSRFARVLPQDDGKPPNLLISIWFRNRALADKLILARRSVLRAFMAGEATSAAVYRVKEAQIA